MDYFRNCVCSTLSKDIFRDLLHIVLVSLAEECATHYFAETPFERELYTVLDHELPPEIIKDHAHSYPAFKEQLQGAEWPEDTRRELSGDQRLRLQKAMEPYIPAGAELTFYEGLAQGLRLSILTIVFFRDLLANPKWIEDCYERLSLCHLFAVQLTKTT